MEEIVLNIYDPRAATLEFKNILNAHSDTIGFYFEQLRSHAALRREFNSFLLKNNGVDFTTRNFLNQLGLKISLSKK